MLRLSRGTRLARPAAQPSWHDRRAPPDAGRPDRAALTRLLPPLQFTAPSAKIVVLVVATLVWGGSFVITRAAVQGVPPLIFVGLRFLVAALVVAAITRPPGGLPKPVELRAGGLIGLAMLGGYTLQAVAMHRGVDSGRAAFISSLYVPLVPLLQLLVLRRPPPPRVWAALALACLGLMLMTARGLGRAAEAGPQLLVLLGACSIAAEIMLVGAFAGRVDPRRLAIIECAVLGACCATAVLASGTPFPPLATGWLAAAFGLGVASAALQVAVNWAQPGVGAARATLIYTLEPIWAGIFARLGGERMAGEAILGALCILASLLLGATRDASDEKPA